MVASDPPLRRPNARAGTRPGIVVTADRRGVAVPLAMQRVRDLAAFVLRRERVPTAVLSIQFVSPAAIARIHRRVLGVGGSTDIVTVEHAREAPGAPHVGEIHIAPAVAARNAVHHGTTAREEIARLVVHGTLHAIGWAHPDTAARLTSPMWTRQEQLLRAARQAGVL
jgi:probable rRNA maturation factor